MKTLTFRSKVDTWLGAALVAATAATLWGSVHGGTWMPTLTMAAVLGAFVFPLRYEIDYDYCKGCGICAAECPCGAIDMIPEVR